MADAMIHNRLEASDRCCKAAVQVMPGGVNSPVRAFGAVGGTPPFIVKGAGPILTDVDGNDYLDYVCSWGAIILGHADKRIEAAVSKAAAKGCSFGAPTELETQLAELVVSLFDSIDMVRFVSSGTEAVMSAIRLARAYTDRGKIIKCKGCYHGHSDAMLVEAGSGAATLGQPSSPGIPAGSAADTLLMPYNDLAAAKKLFAEHGASIAAIIIEPIAGNMGMILPDDGYLAGLRALCDQNKSLLIFDEVITGFRVSRSGAQGLFGLKPDLTCLGKILGGGLPVAAFGGRREIMKRISPAGPVYQAGTLSGNPLAMAAGLAALQALAEPDIYQALRDRAALLAEGLSAAAEEAGIAVQVTRCGSMGSIFFADRPVKNFADARKCDTKLHARWFHAMLERGIYLAPSQFECFFVSTAHEVEHIEKTIEAAEDAFAAIANDKDVA